MTDLARAAGVTDVPAAAPIGERGELAPPGADLAFDLPGNAERALAFAIDIVITGMHLVVWTVILAPFDLGSDPTLAALLPFAFWTVGLAYFVLFWAGSGQTPGMQPFHQRVVRIGDLGPIGLGRALLRLVALIVSVVSVVGVLWILADPRRRGLHDRIAGTQVIVG